MGRSIRQGLRCGQIAGNGVAVTVDAAGGVTIVPTRGPRALYVRAVRVRSQLICLGCQCPGVDLLVYFPAVTRDARRCEQ